MEKNMEPDEMNFNFMRIEFGKLEIKAGDIFVMRFAGRLSTKAIAEICEGMKKILPQSVQILILENDVQIGVLSVQK